MGKLVNRTFGTVSLTIAVDSVCDKHTFYVLDTEPLYHLLLGRPWINLDKGIASSYHQCFKFVLKGSQRRITGEKKPFKEHESHFVDAEFFMEGSTVNVASASRLTGKEKTCCGNGVPALSTAFILRRWLHTGNDRYRQVSSFSRSEGIRSG